MARISRRTTLVATVGDWDLSGIPTLRIPVPISITEWGWERQVRTIRFCRPDLLSIRELHGCGLNNLIFVQNL